MAWITASRFLERWVSSLQQEAELVLIGLALADVDGDRGRADDSVPLVAQRLDQEVEGALAPEQLEIGLELLRLAGCP